LTIASGILFREVSTIPYGRIQSAKIDEGPVDRRYGLAKLTMSTAAAGCTVTLPGLPKEEAERLRRLVTERGIEKMAALRALRSRAGPRPLPRLPPRPPVPRSLCRGCPRRRPSGCAAW